MHKKLLLLLLIVNSYIVSAQDLYEKPINELLNKVLEIQKNNAKGFSFENFTMGIKGGVNFSLVIPTSGNSIFSGSNSEKDYNPFYQNIAYQMGFILRYSITRAIKLSVQPSINEYSYRYSTEYSWTGSTNLSYLLEYKQSMRFFEIPLIAGYYFKAQKWQPYVQGGGYYAMLMNSDSYTDITETLDNQVLNSSSTVNSNGIYKKNQFGILAGAGIRYAAGRTLIGFEANYRFLLTPLSSTASRYGNNQIIGNYDISDDVLFNNIAFTINITVPLVCNEKKNGPYIFCEAN
jgi:hypothetical protein